MKQKTHTEPQLYRPRTSLESSRTRRGRRGAGPKGGILSRSCIDSTFELFRTNFGTTLPELDTSMPELYRTLSLELSICLVCSFVYNLLIVLDFAIPNYPELLDLLLVSFPLAPLSRSQIPSHHSLIRAPNSHHSFVILRSLITVAHPLTR